LSGPGAGEVNAVVYHLALRARKMIADAGPALSEMGVEGDEIRPVVQKPTEQQILDSILQAPRPADSKIPVLRVNHPCLGRYRKQGGNEAVKVDDIMSGEDRPGLPSFGAGNVKPMTKVQRMTRQTRLPEFGKKLAFAPSKQNGNGKIRLGLLGSCKIIGQSFDPTEMGGPEDMHDPDHKNDQPVAKGMK